MSCNRIFYFSFVVKNLPSLQLTRLKKRQSRFLCLRNLAIKFENWNMKNEFPIFNFLIKIGTWNLKIFYHFLIFDFEIKIEICKNVLFHFNFKLKIEWHFRCTDSTNFAKWNVFYIELFCSKKIGAPKVPFNFHFEIGMENEIFKYFNFDAKLKIEKW